MKKWIDSAVSQWTERFRRREIVDVSRRMLPDTLQQDLLEGIERERAAVLERLQVIDQEIAKLQRLRVEARGLESTTHKRLATSPAREMVCLDGSKYVKPPKDRGVSQTTKETAGARVVLRKLGWHLRAFEAEKQHRLAEVRQLRTLQGQVEAGITTALVTICERFRSGAILLRGLPERAKLGASFGGYSDAAGYPWPEAALDPLTGEPDLPRGKPPAASGPGPGYIQD